MSSDKSDTDFKPNVQGDENNVISSSKFMEDGVTVKEEEKLMGEMALQVTNRIEGLENYKDRNLPKASLEQFIQTDEISSSKFMEDGVTVKEEEKLMGEMLMASTVMIGDDAIDAGCERVVADRLVDVGTEWRSFSNERSGTDTSRVDPPENPLMGASDLSTSIAVGFGSSESVQSAASKEWLKRQGINHIREMCECTPRIERVKHRATLLFFAMVDENMFKDEWEVSSQATACVFVVCREIFLWIPIKEVHAAGSCSPRQTRLWVHAIGDRLRENYKYFKMITCDEAMGRYCCNLGLPHSLQDAAAHIIRIAHKKNIDACLSPIWVASASIYMASQSSMYKKSINEVCDVTGAAEEMVKQTYRLLRPEAPRLFPENFNFGTPVDQLPIF